jgi:hypothetical protein
MDRNQVIGMCVGGLIFGLVMLGMHYQTHLCKVEAIKAGMKGDEVIKACGR